MGRDVKKTLNYLQLFKLFLQILLQARKEKWLQNKSYEFLYPAVRQSLKKKREREQTQACGRSNKRCICAPFITMSSSDACRYCLAERGTGKDYHSPMSSAGQPPLALLLLSSLEAGQDREGQYSANGTSQSMPFLQKIASPELQNAHTISPAWAATAEAARWERSCSRCRVQASTGNQEQDLSVLYQVLKTNCFSKYSRAWRPSSCFSSLCFGWQGLAPLHIPDPATERQAGPSAVWVDTAHYYNCVLWP